MQESLRGWPSKRARCRVGQLADRRRHIGARRQLRDQGLNFAQGLARGAGQHRLVVLRREVRTQHPHGRQRHRAGGEPIEDHRKETTGAGGSDAIARGVLGQAEDGGAVAEERTVALGGVDRRPGVERRQVRHELGGGLAFFLGEGAESREKIVIGKGGGESEHVRVHALCVSRRFSPSGDASGSLEEPRTAAFRRAKVLDARRRPRGATPPFKRACRGGRLREASGASQTRGPKRRASQNIFARAIAGNAPIHPFRNG